MATTVCAYCKSVSAMSPVWGETKVFTLPSGAQRYRFSVACICNNQSCRGINIARGTSDHRIDSAQLISTATMSMDKSASIEWHPTTVSERDYPAVPAAVGRAAKEAHRCATTGSPMAAILMARTVVEATAKSKGIETGNLLAKIDGLQAGEFIRANVARAAHAIRHFGNDMAHGDIEDEPTTADAEIVLKLMDLVLVEVFEGDALTEAILASRGPEARAARAVPPSSS